MNADLLPIKVDGQIELHLLEEAHAQLLFALTEANRTYLRRWLPWLDRVQVPGDSRAFIVQSRRNFAAEEGLTAGIWLPQQLVGVIGFHDLDWSNRKGSIGYWLDAEQQGKGIASRACRALVDLGFGPLQLNRIEIQCAAHNRPSRAIPERLGFTFEGIRRQDEWLYDHFVDGAVYSLLAEEWAGAGRTV